MNKSFLVLGSLAVAATGQLTASNPFANRIGTAGRFAGNPYATRGTFPAGVTRQVLPQAVTVAAAAEVVPVKEFDVSKEDVEAACPELSACDFPAGQEAEDLKDYMSCANDEAESLNDDCTTALATVMKPVMKADVKEAEAKMLDRIDGDFVSQVCTQLDACTFPAEKTLPSMAVYMECANVVVDEEEGLDKNCKKLLKSIVKPLADATVSGPIVLTAENHALVCPELAACSFPATQTYESLLPYLECFTDLTATSLNGVCRDALLPILQPVIEEENRRKEIEKAAKEAEKAEKKELEALLSKIDFGDDRIDHLDKLIKKALADGKGHLLPRVFNDEDLLAEITYLKRGEEGNRGLSFELELMMLKQIFGTKAPVAPVRSAPVTLPAQPVRQTMPATAVRTPYTGRFNGRFNGMRTPYTGTLNRVPVAATQTNPVLFG